MFIRTRRLRSSKTMRNMVKNITLSIDEFIYPLFIEEGKNIKEEITSMPGQYRFSIDRLGEELQELIKKETDINNMIDYTDENGTTYKGLYHYSCTVTVNDNTRRVNQIRFYKN